MKDGRQSGFSVEHAAAGDLVAIRALLEDAHLPVNDVGRASQVFLVARSAGAVIGCVALEPYSDAALLRSLVVTPAHRGKGMSLPSTSVRSQRLGHLASVTCTCSPQRPRRSSPAGASVASSASRCPRRCGRARSLPRSAQPRRPA